MRQLFSLVITPSCTCILVALTEQIETCFFQLMTGSKERCSWLTESVTL